MASRRYAVAAPCNDRNLALEVVRITEAAALASARLMGRGDRKLADHVAVEAMRRAFDAIDIRGTVVIGEGERDEAPMLFIGETRRRRLARQRRGLAEGRHRGRSARGHQPVRDRRARRDRVIAIADDGQFLNAPDTYMQKIAVGPEAAA